MIDEDDVATGEFAAVEVDLDDEGRPIAPRVSTDWLWSMRTMVTRMKQRGKYNIVSEETFRPVPEIIRGTVESAAGMVVAPTIASLYEVSDGYELQWTGEDDLGGKIHLYGFAEVFGTWLHKLWGEHDEDAPSSEVDFTWEIRGFDAASDDDPHQVVLHTADGLPSYNLYWHAPRGNTYRMRVGFLEYLERLRETRGLHGWQYMVCDADLTKDEEARFHVARCTSWMKAHFPDVDLSNYTTLDD